MTTTSIPSLRLFGGLVSGGLALLGVCLFFEWRFGSYQAITDIWCLDSKPYFIDLKVLLVGLDDSRAGKSPYMNFANTFNYPLSWTVFAPLGFLKAENLLWIGVFQILFFFVFSSYFLARFKCPYFLSCLILFSPAVLLGLERGNCDLVIFLGLGFALLLSGGGLLALGVILCAGLLKIYPLSCVVGWFFESKELPTQRLLWIILMLCFFSAVFLFTFQGYLQVAKLTPHPVHYMSYGLAALPTLVANAFAFPPPVKVALILIFYGLIGGGVWLACRHGSFLDGMGSGSDPMVARFFFAGTSCFLASSLIGYNWEYRLVFLIFCLPAVFSLRKTHPIGFALIFGSIAFLCWQSFWADFFSRWLGKASRFYYFSDLVNVLLFVLLASSLVSLFKLKTNKARS